LLAFWRQKTRDGATQDDENIHYISDKKIDRFITTLIVILGLGMLIAPLWILAFVEALKERLGVICAFIVTFVVLLSATTVARPFESLAAAAA